MASINDIIKQSFNPFYNLPSGNFWNEQQDQALTVESIHEDALTEIKSVLKQVASDHTTRTLILSGDAGVGKTYFLGRLKKTLNSQAFFVYIEPFPQSQYIWRHILRYTVDSLVQSPDGQKDSQLLLWLKSCLSAISNQLDGVERNLITQITKIGAKEDSYYQNKRHKFVNILKKIFQTKSIYNANEFFGILYELTNPELNSLACEWLKGDNLDEDSLKKLGVGRCIDNENSARNLLGNLSKISSHTQPIVFCFDQLDNIARLPDSSIDLPALFRANSTIHNEKWQGMLVIISIRTSTWRNNKRRIEPSDLARINALEVYLKHINLEEAKLLWATRFYHLHTKAHPKPSSNIYPLQEEQLKEEFPGGKALTRDVLSLGEDLIQKIKCKINRGDEDDENGADEDEERKKIIIKFKLLWLDEFKKSQEKITRIRQRSSIELIEMLGKTLLALQVQSIQPKLLKSPAYAHTSFSYKLADNKGKSGVVWTEDPNMRTFCNVMRACHKVVQQKQCQPLYLIRAEKVAKPGLVGHKIYTEVFKNTHHRHIKTDLNSVHYLATYQNLVHKACAGELVIGTKVINQQEIESLIRESEIMQESILLQELGVFEKTPEKSDKVKDFLFYLVKTNYILGRTILTNKVKEVFGVEQSRLDEIIEKLNQENKIKLLVPNDKPENQSICWIPNI